ncbi:MAG: hypothetical protein V3T64_08655 [Myxococcota bacterium]
MAITLDLESVEGIAIGIAHGDLTLDEIEESAATMWRVVGGPEVRMLWDLRDARFDLAQAEVSDLAEYIKGLISGPAIRTAFVASRDLEFGLLRMFEMLREAKGVRTSVFRDKEHAIEWLRSDAVDYDAAPQVATRARARPSTSRRSGG